MSRDRVGNDYNAVPSIYACKEREPYRIYYIVTGEAMAYRCRQQVGLRKCYRNAFYRNLCRQHCRRIFDWAVLHVQRHFRGKKARRLLRSVLLRLPEELQRLVIWFVRRDHLIEQEHHRPIRFIVNRYIKTLPYMRFLGASHAYVSHVVYLARKYTCIMPLDRTRRAYLLH